MQTDHKDEVEKVQIDTMSEAELAKYERKRNMQNNIALLIAFLIVIAFAAVGLFNMLTHAPSEDIKKEGYRAPQVVAYHYQAQPVITAFSYQIQG